MLILGWSNFKINIIYIQTYILLIIIIIDNKLIFEIKFFNSDLLFYDQSSYAT